MSVRFGKTQIYYSDNAENANKSFCTAALLSVNTDLIVFSFKLFRESRGATKLHRETKHPRLNQKVLSSFIYKRINRIKVNIVPCFT